MMHEPVLLRESIEGLKIKPDGIYVDGTLGRGGHTIGIANKLTTGRIVAIDCDSDAIDEAKKILSGQKDLIKFVHGNFKDITEILDGLGIEKVDGMLFDFGVSSPQLDNSERGFSYKHDAPLDMRMDKSRGLTALEVVNWWSEDELRHTFYMYGEERFSGLVARAIVKKRTSAPISTTHELSQVIVSSLPPSARRVARHPAKRCFQALRIAVNGELEAIAGMLDSVPGRLKEGGRICAITFHSLEDRLVKNSFSTLATGCVCPKDFPVCICGKTPVFRIITRKPITPLSEEVERNPRARSAKLRIAERV